MRRREMAKRKNIKWTPAMEQQLIILRQAGMKPRDIARIMGISRIAVYNRSSLLGITKTSAQLEMDLQVAPATEPNQPTNRQRLLPKQSLGNPLKLKTSQAGSSR
jgi:hypothetical protein